MWLAPNFLQTFVVPRWRILLILVILRLLLSSHCAVDVCGFDWNISKTTDCHKLLQKYSCSPQDEFSQVVILLSTIVGLKTLVCSDVPHWILDCNSFWVADCVAAEVSLIPSPAFLCPLSNLKIRVWVTWVSGSLLDWIYHTGGSMFPCNHY